LLLRSSLDAGDAKRDGVAPTGVTAHGKGEVVNRISSVDLDENPQGESEPVEGTTKMCSLESNGQKDR